MFHTDAEKLKFLLEADADIAWLTEVDDNLSAEAKAEERPKYITNYIGSKQKLVDWIWQATPDNAKSAVDAFSGSSVIGYMFKSKGLAVQSMDRLNYCYHISRAIVENDKVTLSDDEIDALLTDSGKSRDFVRKNFGGIYYNAGVHKQIDIVRSNIDRLSGYKKDIAIFSLGKTCITAKGGFGHFGTSKKYGNSADSPAEFKERFKKNCQRINALVFEGEKSCKAHHGDTRKLLAKINADVAYFDPPYATHFSQTNYERAYHFIEGLMTWWEGKEIKKDSVTRAYDIPTEVTKANSHSFFEAFLSAASHIAHWIISYRDQAYPSESEIKKIISKNGKSSRMKSKTHQYSISAKHGENSLAKERLFICSPGNAKAEFDDEALDAYGEIDEQEAFYISLTGDHDPDLLEALADPKDNDAVRVTSFMGNKYFILDFLWKQTPKDVGSVLDAFSGGANVAYFFKKKGLRVIANDKLHYPHHIARALIENSKTTLSEDDIESIFAESHKSGIFCVDNFYGYYFTKPILQFLDQAWANIQHLSGYKKDLALTALGWTVVGKAKFGQFSRSKKGLRGPASNLTGRQTSLTNIPLANFTKLFRKHLARANRLVFDNGQDNKATRLDAIQALKSSHCDLVYADPPYITQFGSNDYESNLHFVEGLMTMWDGKDLRDNSKHDYESCTKYNRDSIADLIADIVTHGQAKHLMLSYRDKAFPDEHTIQGFFKERFKQSRVKGIDVEYGLIRNNPASGGKHARELIFIGSEPLASKAAVYNDVVYNERNIHTRITGNVKLDSLSSNADKTGDKRFKFILTHIGSNRNGDHFTAEELKQAAKTAIGKKIDLSHSQEFRDIVGGIVEAKFIEDGNQSRIECVGELYTEESEPARLAYKLMKRGIVSHVSMECDYQNGECSICKKYIKNKSEYCTHLKNFKGRDFKGKACFEILHGITFTGMGLLDREGADERAEIKQVAHNTLENYYSLRNSNNSKNGGDNMAQEKTKVAAETPPAVNDLSEAEKAKLIKSQQVEIDRLAKELEALKKQFEDAQASHRAVVRKTKAERLLNLWEEAGRDFGDEASRTAEIERLMGMSDDYFAATEETVSTFAVNKKKQKEVEDEKEQGEQDDAEKEKKKQEKDKKETEDKLSKSKKSKARANLSSDADTRPVAVPTSNPSDLADKLTKGFMAAYKDRAGIEPDTGVSDTNTSTN